jgi:hypothetical protein
MDHIFCNGNPLLCGTYKEWNFSIGYVFYGRLECDSAQMKFTIGENGENYTDMNAG